MLTHIWKATGRQTHGRRAHKGATHHQQIRMRFGHTGAYRMHQGQNDQRGNCMTDESRNDKDQRRKNDQDAIETHAVHFLRDGAGDRV